MRKKCGWFILGMLIAGLFVMVKIYKSSTKIITTDTQYFFMLLNICLILHLFSVYSHSPFTVFINDGTLYQSLNQ